MQLTNARIVEMDGRHVVICDNLVAQRHLTPRGGRVTHKGRAPREMAIVTSSRQRAEELTKMAAMFVGAEITPLRSAGHQLISRKLHPRLVLFDRRNDDDDDARIKRENPPPPGIDISFRWCEDDVLRADAVTLKDGEITTRSAIVETSYGSDVAAEIAKVYERFARTSPATQGERQGLRCAAHTAMVLSKLDPPAMAQFTAWRDVVDATPRMSRGKLGTLVLPLGGIDPAMTFVKLKALKGRDLVEAEMHFRDGAVVDSGFLKFTGDLPQSVLAGLPGRSADTVWGQEELRDVVIGEYVTSNPQRDKAPQHVFRMSVPFADMPPTSSRPCDDLTAAASLQRIYRAHTFDTTLRDMLARLSPAWLLHVLRAAFYADNQLVDLDFIPGGRGVRVRLSNKHLGIVAQGTGELADLWR